MKKRKSITLLILFTVLFSPFAYIIYAYNESYGLFKEFKDYKQPLATKIFDIKGRLISELYEEYRDYADTKEIPEEIKEAFLAAEDHDFYMHTGFDIIGIIRAIVIDISSGKLKQGGSTITQQLVKQIYTNRERSIKRKLVELFITKEFEEKFTKEEILEMYLNHIYFGHGIYGVKAASEFFFSKKLKDINFAEAAVLAAIPSAPARYSPFKHPDNSYKRSESVMFNLIAQGRIKRDEGAAIFNSFWKDFRDKTKTAFPDETIRRTATDMAPWFTEYIRRILIKKYGEEKVYGGGLTVMTSLNIDYQRTGRKLLEEALERHNSIAERANRYKLKIMEDRLYRKSMADRTNSLSKTEFRKLYKIYADTNRSIREEVMDSLSLTSLMTGCENIDDSFRGFNELMERHRKSSHVEGALVAVEPQTGNILTMVGGSNFSHGNQLNRAVQSRRQPGSAFKAFVYGAAIDEKKITAATSFDDLPVTYKSRKDSWSPSNYSRGYTGKVLVRRALAKSLNVIPARIYDIVGGEAIAKFASKMTGIPLKRFEIDPTLSLGTTEVTPMEITKGMAVYANTGKSVKLKSILEIKDRDGKVIFTPKPAKKKQIVSAATSYIITSLLSEVVNSGTASYAVRRAAGFTSQCAGKTGTNTKFRDAWFTGFTSNLAATVWVGCDSPEYTLGHGQSGSGVAAPIWGKYMKEVYKTRKAGRFAGKPGAVTVRRICTITGNLASSNCRGRNEFFIKGTEPKEKCEGLHGKLSNIKELIRLEKNRVKRKSINNIFKKDNDNTEEDTGNNKQKESREVFFFD